MKNKIVLFSDLHYGKNMENNKGGNEVNTFGNTEKLIEKFLYKITKINPLAIINLGDISHENIKEKKEIQYKQIIDKFKKLNIQNYLVLGNHDTHDIDKTFIEELMGHNFFTVFELGGYKHIIFDIEKNDKGLFQVSNSTLEKLKMELNNSLLEKIIYCHYPITEEINNISYYHINRQEKSFLYNSKELRNILEDSNTVLVISGHTHHYYETLINGIKYYTIPSFAENKNGKPSGEYAILDLENLEIKIESIF